MPACRHALARFLGAALVLLAALPSDATPYDDGFKSNSDILMKEHRWPRWDAGTYYAIWSSGFYPRKGNFYGGVPTRGPKGKAGMFWNIWGHKKNVHEGPQFYRTGKGAEGASGAAAGKPDFLRPNAWYRFVMRVYQPAHEKKLGKYSYVGWWVKDIERDTWHTHSIVGVLGAPTGIAGNRSFIEALAPGNVRRSIDRRLGYGRLDGKWYKADTIKCAPGARFMLIEDGTVVRYDSFAKEAGGHKSYTTRQPDLPALDKPNVVDAVATAWGKQVSVRWAIPRNASPQLGYRIEVFDNSGARGEAMVTAHDLAPYMLSRRLDTPRPARSVRLTIIDIFDQEKTVVLRPRTAALAPRVEPRQVRAGLAYKFYAAPGKGRWTKLPDFAELTPAKIGTVTGFDDTVREERRTDYAIQFAGYLRAPADGLYVLSAGTCDGSRLRVDGKLVCDNDGIHSAGIKQVPLALSEGLHRLELDTFKGPQNYEHVRIDMSWEGPGFARRPFTPSDFVCDDAGDLPLLTLEVRTPTVDGVLTDNLAEIHAVPKLRGHKLAKIDAFVGELLLGSVRALDDDGHAVFKSVLPRGKSRVWARLWYDGNNSVNATQDLWLTAENRNDGPWKFTVVGPGLDPLGARCKGGVISFAGEGFCAARQAVEGDYTLTVRVADIVHSTRSNGVHGGNWVGIYDMPRNGRNREGRYVADYDDDICGIYVTAGKGIRAVADYPDLASTRMTSWPVADPGHRWLRLVRRGRRTTSYTSADGRTWRPATEKLLASYAAEHDAAIVFRGIPGKSPVLFRGKVDCITLERGKTPPEPARPKADPASLKLGNRITGIVQCHEAPETLYARSPTRGVLVSTDRGATWREANGGLASTPEAMAVRSVAVHPTDPKKVLRAGGAVIGGKHKSGLWLSDDGGASWKRLTTDIDFDGAGPTTLFGEVVAFANAPKAETDVIVAAGESKGLFTSGDGGKTWKSDFAGGKYFRDERITSILADADLVIVGTFDDDEFETLGLGRPAIEAARATVGRMYAAQLRPGGAIVVRRPPVELDHLGVTGAAVGYNHRFLSVATTRGIYFSHTGLAIMHKRRYRDLPADACFLAMGHRRFLKLRKDTQYDPKATCYAVPFTGPDAGRVHRVVERLTFDWNPVAKASRFPGTTCVLPDWKDKKIVYLCDLEGIHKSTDEGRTFGLVCKSPVKE